MNSLRKKDAVGLRGELAFAVKDKFGKTKKLWSENALGRFLRTAFGLDLQGVFFLGRWTDKLVFHNLVVSAGKAGMASRCNGAGAEAAFTYLAVGTQSQPVWAATTAYSLGDRVVPTSSNGFYYECTTAGTSAGTEPTWPTTIGNTVVDGTVTWTCFGGETPNAGDTTLMNEITTGGLARASATVSRVTTTVTNDTAQLDKTWSVTASFAVKEAGALNAASSGTLLGRQTFSAVNVANGDTLQVIYKFQMS